MELNIVVDYIDVTGQCERNEMHTQQVKYNHPKALWRCKAVLRCT